MATLYEIDERLKALEEMMVDLETGEIIDNEEEFNKLFDEIQLDLMSKIENTCCFIKSLHSDVKAFKQEQKALAKRRKVKEKLAERLQSRIDSYIKSQYIDDDGILDKVALNKYKFETPKCYISYRKSDSVKINDLSKIPDEFIKERKITEDDINKTMIKKLIKDGETIEGAEIVTNVNMNIK